VLEKVERRVPSMVSDLMGNNFEERSKGAGHDVEERRRQLDIVQAIKIIKGHDTV
jgi:hypothetical protein